MLGDPSNVKPALESALESITNDRVAIFTMWGSTVPVNKYTLQFPPAQEQEFAKEHCASNAGRKLLIIFTLCAVFFIVPIAVSRALTPSNDQYQNWIIPYGCSFVFGNIGMTYLMYRSEEGYKNDYGRFLYPPPIYPLTIGVVFVALRTENLIYVEELYKWRLSQSAFLMLLCCMFTGINFRYITCVSIAVIYNILDFTQNLIVLARFPSGLSLLRVFGNIAPGIFANLILFVRSYHVEVGFRLQFSGFKRTQIALLKLEAVEKTMVTLLENMLPKAVIPRLISSKLKFSTVTDRYERAYSIFIDFFHTGEIKGLDPEMVAAMLNETFVKFDEILMDFPMIEKVKTISSKSLLIAIPSSDNPEPGSSLTELVKKVYILFHANVCKSKVQSDESKEIRHSVRIGVAYGGIVAGIVGEEKFCYDVYGDAINAGNKWRSIGVQMIKGKGEMTVYELTGLSKSDSDSDIAIFADNRFSKRRPSLSNALHQVNLFKLRNATPVNRLTGVSESSNFSSLESQQMMTLGSKVRVTVTSNASMLTGHQFSSDVTPPQAGLSSSKDVGFDNSFLRQSVDNVPVYRNMRSMESLIVTGSRVLSHGSHHQIVPITEDEASTKNANVSNERVALHKVIDEIAPVLLTINTESLMAILAKYILELPLSFKNPHIEKLFQDNNRQHLSLYVVRHTRTMATMMCGFSILVILYELLLVGQVGEIIEEALENGETINFAESSERRIYRLTSVFLITLTSTIELLCVFYQTQRTSHTNTDTVLNSLLGSSSKSTLSAKVQYLLQIFVIMVFGIAIITGPTYSMTWLSASSLIPLIGIAISLTVRASPSFATRALITLVCDGILCFARYALVAPLTLAEWPITVVSVLFTQFTVHRSEVSDRVGFLLQETLQSTQMKFDQQAYLSAGLLNAVLPNRIIQKLMNLGNTVAESSIVEKYDLITILHLDVVSFTVISSTLEPQVLITRLNALFSTFDKICRRHNVEKILTIGDAYVAAKMSANDAIHSEESIDAKGRHHNIFDNKTYADSVCRVGLEMQVAMQVPSTSFHGFQIRVGIHSGKAAGFITGGLTKMKYELFGDTVDLAEKVQEKAKPGTVFASASTVSHISRSDFSIQKTDLSVADGIALFEIHASKITLD
ncbi:hypothetical protein HDU76_009656 [Blyttiomyces sp. JEL0837]|nr:hypothetical protein HDU76_009656 [Blyttiomyces sp. JEL0837]